MIIEGVVREPHVLSDQGAPCGRDYCLGVITCYNTLARYK